MTIRVNPQTAASFDLNPQQARALVERLLASPPAATPKQDKRSTVTRHDLDGRSWIVKRYHLPAIKRWLYSIVRRTPAWQEWAGAKALQSIGVRSSPPLALAGHLVLVLAFHEGRSLHDWMRETTDREKRLNVAERVGRQIGRITAAGWVNRDHKPTNLIVDAACKAGEVEPILIDPAGMRRRTPDKTLRMLAVMYRATPRARGISIREGLTALRAAIRADPSLATITAAALARAVLAQVNARPLSYDPADWV